MRFRPERIREARQAARLSQGQLAGRLGKLPPQISNWERGKHEPRTGTVVAIARETGKPLEFFYGEGGDEETALAFELLSVMRRVNAFKEAA